MKNVVLLIPSLDPSESFITFIKDALVDFKDIVVVNDGSAIKYDYIFNEIEKSGAIVLKHHLNLGKGRALKYAFNYILNTYPKAIGVVMADSDGQHLISDIKRVSRALVGNRDSLILGVRNFDDPKVPMKSKMGNKITRNVLKYLVGITLSDTQTGLRALSVSLMKTFLTTTGERFEYETNMLIDTKKYHIKMIEVPITTVYINDNRASHFNPFKDSYRIYKLFFKYILSALSSFILDIILFSLFIAMFGNHLASTILIATILSRIISSLYNYMINAMLVYNHQSSLKTAIKYYSLVIINMFISGLLVAVIGYFASYLILVKIAIDLIIFFTNFYIQNNYIFKKR